MECALLNAQGTRRIRVETNFQHILHRKHGSDIFSSMPAEYTAHFYVNISRSGHPFGTVNIFHTTAVCSLLTNPTAKIRRTEQQNIEFIDFFLFYLFNLKMYY